MKIETKFNVGDTVYTLEGFSIKEMPIYSLVIRVYSPGKVEIKYTLESGKNHDDKTIITERFENQVFATKEELLKSL